MLYTLCSDMSTFGDARRCQNFLAIVNVNKKNSLLCALKIQSSQQGSVMIVYSKNIHTTHTAPCTTNTFSGRRSPDANLFQSLKQRLRDMEVERIRHLLIQVAYALCGHQTIKMPQLQLWNDGRGEAHRISHEKNECPRRGLSK